MDNNIEINYDNQKIVDVELEGEMKKSYIDYAMSVIVGRALPDVRDGLKPVHRRILYAMHEDNLTADRPYRKSATTVGNVLGRYHPHGDAAVYDSMVRMAQSFSLRYPMIDGHGNFGSIDGHPAAAYRYTEARMSKLSAYMLTDIEKDTVDFMPNFDNDRKEPVVLPSRFPSLLVNGSSGIAVGMATNIPPHNLSEVINATCYLIDHPDAEIAELLEYIKGPDFPTGGIIMGRMGMRAAYMTGRGRIKVRARTEIEEHSNGKFRIIVKEIPYMVNKARLVKSIADLHKDKKVDGITDLRDESSGRSGIRIVIDLRKDVNPQVVLNQLFQYTQMEDTFSMIMLALVNGQPKTLSLREILDNYISFQREVIERRTRFDLKKAQARAHLLEGLRIACDNIDEVIHIIRTSYNDAKQRLIERFELSEIQAQAILEMQLRRLQGLEREKIEEEYNALLQKIDEYNQILASKQRQLEIVKEELLEIKNKFGDERRTEISMVEDEIDIEDLIDEEECVYTLTRYGYIKRVPASTYRAQRRGGKGIVGMVTRDEDFVQNLFTASTHHYVLFISNFGKVYRLKGYMIPEGGRTAKGMNIVNLLQLEQGEKITAMMHTKEFDDDTYVMMATRQGVIKRMRLKDLYTARKAGVRVLTIGDGDELITAKLTGGNSKIMIITAQGKAIRFDENEVRTMGRSAAGVRGIKLADGDYVVGAVRQICDGFLLTVTENGYGKLTAIDEFTEHHRGGSGMTAHAVTEKTGLIAGVRIVTLENDVLIITEDGTIIRTAAESIRLCGRSSQGVILMRTDDNVKVISVEKTSKEKDEDEIADDTADIDERQSGEDAQNESAQNASNEPDGIDSAEDNE